MFNIAVASGELCHVALDFSFPGFIPVEFDRAYRSGRLERGPLGVGWAFSYQIELDIDGDIAILRRGALDPIQLQTKRAAVGEVALDGFATWFGSEVHVRHGTDILVFPTGSPGSRVPIARLQNRRGNTLRFYHDGQGRLLGFIDTMARVFAVTHNTRGLIEEIAIQEGDARRTSAVVSYDYDSGRNLIGVRDTLGHRCTYAYDAHLLVSMTNTLGGSTYAQYDDRRRCIRTWRGDGKRLRTLLYDDHGRFTIRTDSIGHRTVYRFDEDGRIVEEVDASGNLTRYVLDAQGRLVSSIDGDGGIAVTLVDRKQGTISAIRRSGEVLQVRESDNQSVREVTDGTGATWRYEYDAQGLPTRLVSPSGLDWRYAYDARGAVVSERLPTGMVHTYRYDSGYRVHQTFNGETLAEERKFDSFGRQISRSTATGYNEQASYDAVGRLISLRFPNGANTTFVWDTEGNLVEIVQADGARRRYAYSPFNDHLSTIDENDAERSYRYDTECRLVSIREENGDEMEFEYDALGRVVRQVFLDGRVERYQYTAAGHVAEVRSADGQPLAWDVDRDGKLERVRDEVSDLLTCQYDACGRLLGAVDGDSTLEWEYDQDGRTVAQRQTDVTVGYAYDAAGRLVGIDVAGRRSVGYEYDNDGHVNAVVSANGERHSLDWDRAGRIALWRLPSGTSVVRFDYDDVGHLRSTSLQGASAWVREVDWDARGRISRVRAGERAKNYEYDAKGQLRQFTNLNGQGERYLYDVVGNRVSGPGGTTFRFSAGHRLAVADERSYSYDERGRAVSWRDSTGVTGFTYDARDRLVSFTGPDGTETRFGYDALGRRIWKEQGSKRWRFLWDHDFLLGEWLEGSGEAAIYLRLPGAIVPFGASTADGDISFLREIPWGPPVAAVNANGQIVWEAEWDPWGSLLTLRGSDAGSALRYPGQYFDSETGLTYNHHRYFDSFTGLFLSPDPIGINGGSLNLYGYAPDPVNAIDPLGLTLTTVNCTQHCQTNPCNAGPQNQGQPLRITTPCNDSRGSSIHNDCINQAWQRAQAIDPNARRDQAQLSGNNTCRNRPDISLTAPGGPQTFIEFDNPPYSRVTEHVNKICGNNNNAQIFLVAIPATSRYSTTSSGAASGGSIPRNTPGRPTDAECGW